MRGKQDHAHASPLFSTSRGTFGKAQKEVGKASDAVRKAANGS